MALAEPRAGEHDAERVVHIGPRGRWQLGLGELFANRELLYFFVWRDVKVLYKQTAIGIAWVLIQPLATMAVFALVFGKLAGLPSDGLPPPVFYFAGLVLWTYFANAVNRSANSLVQHQALITKVYFPRLLLPISAVAAGLLDFAISFLFLAGLAWWYGVRPTAALVTLPLSLLLTVLTAAAVGIWLSALNAVYRDIRHALPFVLQIWLFASPIAYSASLVPPAWRTWYALNPMAGAVQAFRWSLTGAGDWPGEIFWVSLAAVTLLLVAGVMFFRRIESYLVDVI